MTAPAPTRPSHSRAIRRVLAVAGGVAACTLIWLVVVPLLGHRLVVADPGQSALTVGLAPVMVLSLTAGLSGWALLTVLEKLTTRHAGTAWAAIAALVLLLSFAPLASAETDPGTRFTLRGERRLRLP